MPSRTRTASSAMTTRSSAMHGQLRHEPGPGAGVALDVQRAPDRPDPVIEAAQPGAAGRSAPPAPSSATSTRRVPSLREAWTRMTEARDARVALVRPSATTKYAVPSTGGREAGPARSASSSTGMRDRVARLSSAGTEPALGEDRGMDAAGELPELVDRERDVGRRVLERRDERRIRIAVRDARGRAARPAPGRPGVAVRRRGGRAPAAGAPCPTPRQASPARPARRPAAAEPPPRAWRSGHGGGRPPAPPMQGPGHRAARRRGR